LGYTNREIGWHYFAWSALVGAVGAAAGIAGGLWMGTAMTGLYNEFFRFPVLLFRAPGWVLLVAAAVGLGTGVLGALGAVRRAVRLAPAEARRPEPPAHHHASLLERIGLGAAIGPAARMVLRNIERQPVRGLTSIAGIALSTAIVVLGMF